MDWETKLDFLKPDLDFWVEWRKGLNVAIIIFFADLLLIIGWLWLISAK